MLDLKNVPIELLDAAPFLSVEQLAQQIGASLIVAPHPDDEALACGGMIALLREKEVPVWVVFMTSGEASHRNSVAFPAPMLATLREEEAAKSCEILGVDVSNIIFLKNPDSQLNRLALQDKKRIISELLNLVDTFGISSLFLPWRRDGHPDHIATNQLGNTAAESTHQPIQVFEYPIWLWHSHTKEYWPLKSEVEVFKLDVTQVLNQKKEAIFAHKSQTTSMITDDANGFMLTTALVSPFIKNFEYFFVAPKRTEKSLDKTYFKNLYHDNPDPWNFKESNYEIEKYETIDSFMEQKKYVSGLELGCSIGIQTRFLAKHCHQLLAIDISEEAIASAKELNDHLHNTEFKVMDILEEFPDETFDFISMCEIGYFFSTDAIEKVFAKITEHLSDHGQFLMVHWTSYVKDFPLTGRQVHQTFKNMYQENQQFELVKAFNHDYYELLLWKKNR